ncbi:radical SAM protein [Marinoscillum sp. MHG1-6]|uniref:B12-binding domain-containing radical SAM protein n=1 Tax=Marinoscillum sp. MHG1-6 TaxID=2959627 RepID=UPI0021578BB4|nr:radical SAM protein [Marinoscillum sp. MHG1-6]
MPKILFSHSYFYQLDSKQWKMAEPFPPLMTMTAAGFLRDHGCEVSLFDVGLRENESGLSDILSQFGPDYFVIFDDGFNWLTKMCLTTMREAAFRMQETAHRHGVKVIVCSSDATDHYEKYLDHHADIVIRGEGEMTLKALIDAYENETSLDQVNGIAYRNTSDETLVTPRQAIMTDLDQLPLPAWDLADVDSYRQIWCEAGKTHYLNIATTRGCPYKCNWCAKPIYGQRYNVRSPKKVVDEIEFHLEHHNVDHFWMCDDIFGLKPGWVQEFRNEIEARKLKIYYKIQSRADLLLEEDNIDALVASGLHEVWIGAESGSQKILDAMDKGTTINQIHQSTKLLKQHGVKVGFFIQYGYLNETKQDIELTIAMIKDLQPDSLGISVSYPLPGTKFYEKVQKDLESKANWVDSDDLDMMFQNTYQPSFYRLLHQYTHNVYNRSKSVRLIHEAFSNPLIVRWKHVKSVLKVIYYTPIIIWRNLKLNRLSSS